MPANLPPEYIETERKLKEAKTPQEKLEILEQLLAIVPKHKGTEKLQALLKTKISKLRQEMQRRPQVARHSPIAHLEKSGAGRVVILGSPNSGKSMLIKSLTGANPEVGDYPFTTRIPAPYMMRYENIQIQLIDTPPYLDDDIPPLIPELTRTADGVIICLDLTQLDEAARLENFLEEMKKKKVELVGEKEPIALAERAYKKRTLIVANKCDVEGSEIALEEFRLLLGDRLPLLPVSAWRGDGLSDLKTRIYNLLEIIRVYSKAPGKKPDFDEPFTLRKGSSVIDMARAIHKDLADNFKYARLWRGKTIQGLIVNRDHLLQEGDVVEIHA
ncbi:MAG: TGS domain-containing protein [Candidatus Aminicenantes bacterium]|nr:TGS domain-containing protein [Candidatus Aminicenantes bacterium]